MNQKIIDQSGSISLNWNPVKKEDIDKMEKIQKSFTAKIRVLNWPECNESSQKTGNIKHIQSRKKKREILYYQCTATERGKKENIQVKKEEERDSSLSMHGNS